MCHTWAKLISADCSAVRLLFDPHDAPTHMGRNRLAFIHKDLRISRFKNNFLAAAVETSAHYLDETEMRGECGIIAGLYSLK
jgi:hypothetical protein